MTSKFRLALAGAGMITRGSQLPAALASPVIEVAAIVDPMIERAKELARMFGIRPMVAARIEDIFGTCDGVVIATPNDSHRAVALACLQHKLPVLIEKPLATSYEEGLQIVRAAESTNTVVAVGYSSRHREEVPLLKRLLDEGYFGAVRRFAHQFGTPGGWAPLSAYNLDRRTAGGGVLVVTGTHFLDRLLYFWGYPDEASIEDDSLGGPEANCFATFRFKREPLLDGIARYSKTTKLAGGLVIDTEAGYVILRETDEARLILRPHADHSIEHVIQRTASTAARPSEFQLQLEDFVNACHTGCAPRVDGRQGLESLRLLEQLYRNRRPINERWYGEMAFAAAA